MFPKLENGKENPYEFESFEFKTDSGDQIIVSPKTFDAESELIRWSDVREDGSIQHS